MEHNLIVDNVHLMVDMDDFDIDKSDTKKTKSYFNVSSIEDVNIRH